MSSQTTVLPEKLGGVTIFLDEDRRRPVRIPKGISIPKKLLRKIVILNNETALAQLSFRGVGRHIFFGMDESPFLTGITKNAFEIGQQEGPDAFFNSLIPPFILLLARKSGQPIKRQGDMFAIKVGVSWPNAYEVLAESQEIETVDKVRQRESMLVFQTRHVFSGNIQSCNALTRKQRRVKMKKRHLQGNYFTSKQHFYLVNGILNAPDHDMLDLQPGIFCLMSGVNIASEKMVMRD